MKEYFIEFYLMMQGMHEPAKDYWYIKANFKEEAINKLVKLKGYETDKESSFFRGCLNITEKQNV